MVSAEIVTITCSVKEMEAVITGDGRPSDFSLKLREKRQQWVYQILKQEH